MGGGGGNANKTFVPKPEEETFGRGRRKETNKMDLKERGCMSVWNGLNCLRIPYRGGLFWQWSIRFH
jgi:hypothetical protein